MSMIRLGCAWEVRAGLVPRNPMPEYTKRFWLSGDDRRDEVKYAQVRTEAMKYAESLMTVGGLNWIDVEYLWL